ncbi:MAG: type IX secretion system membrane protein PorP/SprF [Ferruginibacter sp.]
MKLTALLTAALLSGSSLWAQQLHFSSQFFRHNSMYNPAAAGLTAHSSIGISYRNQWGSFPGNPRTYMLFGDFAIRKMKAGIGAYVYRDETGPTSRSGIQLAYSYHIKLNDKNARLGIGLEVRLLQFAIDKTKLSDALGNDPVLAGSSNKIAPDAGAGIYFTNDKFSIGIAASQLIKSKIALGEVSGADIRAKLYRHYNLTASYRWQTGEDIYLVPFGMVRMIENAPTEYEAGAQLDYQDKMWVALVWRNNQAGSVQAGIRLLKKLKFGYSYDGFLTPSSFVNDGFAGHELSLRFSF